MMEFLSSKHFSLICAFLNCFIAYQSFVAGDWIFGLFCAGLGCYCTNNYFKADK